MPKAAQNATPECVKAGGVHSFTGDATHLFLTDSAGHVVRLPKQGGAEVEIWSQPQADAVALNDGAVVVGQRQRE